MNERYKQIVAELKEIEFARQSIDDYLNNQKSRTVRIYNSVLLSVSSLSSCSINNCIAILYALLSVRFLLFTQSCNFTFSPFGT